MLLCLLLLLLLPSAAPAFEGRLQDPAGAPLPGVHVMVLGGRGSAVVGPDGHFLLDPTPPLPFDLLVTRADGVVGQPIHVTALPESGPLVVTVDPSAGESVTVVGSAPDLDLPPASAFTLLGRADLDQRAPAHLAEAMENIPGAGRIEEGQSAVPTLRGLGRSRTLIVVDEGRVTAERRAGPSATFLDPASIDELEIVRGPGAVAYGSDVLGGLIRARTRIPSPGEPFSLRYTGWGTDGADARGIDVEAGANLLGGGLLLGAGARKGDDYESPEGEVFNSGYESMGFRLGTQHVVAGGLLRVLWRTDLGEDIGKPAIDSRETRAWYPEESSHRASVSWERGEVAGFDRLLVAATWSQYDLLTDRYRYATSSKPAQLQEADVFSHDYSFRLEAERPLGEGRLLVGTDLNGRTGLRAVNWLTVWESADPPTLRELSIDSARRDDQGFFAGYDLAVGRLALGTGLRLDHVTSENRGGYFGDRDSSDTAPSGFVAGTFRFTGQLEATLQYSRGFREPLISDRYYHGISGRGFLTGNPDLEAERSDQYDLAIRYRGGPATLAAYVYLYRISDLIERYKQGNDYFFRNRGEAEAKGIEIEAGLKLPFELQAGLALQLPRGEVLDDGSAMDDIPPEGGVLTLQRDPVQPWWWLARLAAYRSDDQPGPSETVRPGYAVIDFGFGYRFNSALEIQLLGRNLADRAYYGTADAAAVLAPGRTFQLTIRGRI